VPNLKLLTSTVVEISMGSQNFCGAPLAQTLTNFGPKSCFWQRYSMTPSYIPNLKSLAKIVAEMSRGSHNFGGAPLARPRQFWSKKLYNKFEVAVASVAADINRGSKNLAVPNVEELHIYTSGGKHFSSTQLSLILPPVNYVIKRH